MNRPSVVCFSSLFLVILFLFTFASPPSLGADFEDLIELFTAFKGGAGGDLNNDGEVDYEDVFLFSLDWKRFFTSLEGSDPRNGEGDVSISRETIIVFDKPLLPSTVTGTSIKATFGGQTLGARLQLSKDGKRVTLFYTNPLPQRARVRVSLDENILRGADGGPVDADLDSQSGGVGTIDFETLGIVTLPGTRVMGRVFASELATAKGSTQEINVPLEGVTLRVDGTSLTAVTDAMGNYVLDPAPIGRFFAHVDGTTVASATIDGVTVPTSFPDGPFYPSVGKPFPALAGHDNPMPIIYLPLVLEGSLLPVSTTQETVIPLPDEILNENPEMAGLEIRVPTGSLFFDNGTPGTRVGLGVVNPNRLPGELPEDLRFPVVITIQTDGATNFDLPVPACFPNLPDPVTGEPLLPGEQNYLYSFNHDKGIWEAIGPMTVSEDGTVICTDPGVGIPAPGWHGTGPPPLDPVPCEAQCCEAAGGSGPGAGGGGGGGGGGSGGGGDDDDDDFPKEEVASGVKKSTCTSCGATTKGGGDPGDTTQPYTCVVPLGPPCDEDMFLHCVFIHEYRFKKRFAWCEKNKNKGFGPNQKPKKGETFEEYCKRRAAEVTDQEVQQCYYFTSGCPPKLGSKGIDLPPIDDPIILQIQAIHTQIDALVADLGFEEEPSPEVRTQMDDLLAQADTVAGGSVQDYLSQFILDAEQEALPFELEQGVPTGNPPPYPVFYYAQIYREDGTLVELRGLTGPFGDYSLFIPRDGELFAISFYDPLTNRIGLENPILRLEDSITERVFRFTLDPVDPTLSDTDSDRLVDVVEIILGTDPESPDTDGDGIGDGAEVEQGLNPLDDRAVINGVIDSRDTPGNAVDVVTVEDVAIVADSGSGVSVFNVFEGMSPTLVAQVDTPGDARRVGLAGNRVIVADGAAGVTVIDISDPPEAAIERQLEFDSSMQGNCVAVQAGLAYVGFANGFILVIDPPTGAILDILEILGSVTDLFFEGDLLYALTDDTLYALEYQSGVLRILGSAASPAGGPSPNRRLFVGGGIAYTVHTDGYNTFDLQNPAQPVLIQASTFSGGSRGWRQLAATSTDIGVFAVGANPNTDSTYEVSLFDISEPTDTMNFITQFLTPGEAQSVSIFNGLAYVADGGAGLQVLNYLAYDNQGIPPLLDVTANFSLDPGMAEERMFARVTADVTDDIQIRNVEFYLDGQLASRDGNFPFEFRFLTPSIVEQATFTLQIRASDTGGNRVESQVYLINLTPDLTGPVVTRIEPRAGGASIKEVTVTFNEPIDPDTLTEANLQLLFEGPLGFAGGKGLGTPVPGGTRSLDTTGRVAVLEYGAPLSNGVYRVVANTGITDVPGNPLVRQASQTLIVADAVFWVGLNGFWNGNRNWNTAIVPSVSDTVIISVPENVRVTMNDADRTVANLYCANRFDVTSFRELVVEGEFILNNLMMLSGGTLRNTTVDMGPKGLLRFPSAGGSVSSNVGNLDGVTLNGNMEMPFSTTTVTVRNGLTLNGRAQIAGGPGSTLGYLFFEGPGLQLLDGTGEVQFTGGGAQIGTGGSGSSLIVGPDIEILGFGIGSVNLGDGGEIQGTVDVTGNNTTVNGDAWTNKGLLRAQEIGTLRLDGDWTNESDLVVEETATLVLAGVFEPSDLGNFTRNGGAVTVAGTVDATTDPLILDASTGSWGFQGRLNNGIVELRDGVGLSIFGGTFDNATLNGNVSIESGRQLQIQNDFTLNGTVSMFGGGGSTFSQVFFENAGDHVLDGTGAIFFGSGGGNAVSLNASSRLIVEPDIEFFGHNGSFSGPSSSSLVNRGTIHSDRVLTISFSVDTLNLGLVKTSGTGSIRIDQDQWVNSGRIEVATGSPFEARSGLVQTATGTLSLDIDGTAPANIASVAVIGHATLDGTLEINLAGGFIPAVSDTFTLMTFDSRGGTFATETLPDPGPGKDFVVNYSDTDVVLGVISE